MNTADRLIEKGAARLQQLADQAAAEGGTKARLAEQLADEAAFLRKLKPSLIAARARGERPVEAAPPAPSAAPAPESTPDARPEKQSTGQGDGPNPFLVVGAAFALGIVLAKLVDWGGHAYPRR